MIAGDGLKEAVSSWSDRSTTVSVVVSLALKTAVTVVVAWLNPARSRTSPLPEMPAISPVKPVALARVVKSRVPVQVSNNTISEDAALKSVTPPSDRKVRVDHKRSSVAVAQYVPLRVVTGARDINVGGVARSVDDGQ